MDPRTLARRIPLGEDSALEFKSVGVIGGFADELAAMANARGGP